MSGESQRGLESLGELLLQIAEFLKVFAELGHEALADVPVSCHPPVPGAELKGVNVPIVAVPVKQPEGMLLTESTGQYIPVDQGGRKGAHGNALTKQVSSKLDKKGAAAAAAADAKMADPAEGGEGGGGGVRTTSTARPAGDGRSS